MPQYTTIGIIDGIMDLLLWNMEKPPGFPWKDKKEMFMEKDLWSQMCQFHPAEWLGSNRQLKDLATTLTKLGVDEVTATQPVSLKLVSPTHASVSPLRCGARPSPHP